MRRRTGTLLVMIGAAWLQGCTAQVPQGRTETVKMTANTGERDCLVRAMYFESNRSSRDGLMAVGTVVMNRVASPRHPDSICGVVGEPRQFAAGVLTRPMNRKELPLVEQAADAVLRGERYAPAREATHFHVAGLRIPYSVHYVAVAGGNAFYRTAGSRVARPKKSMVAAATAPAPEAAAGPRPDAEIAPNLMERLYASLAAPTTGKACDGTSTGFGPKPSACEYKAAGR
jgi:spore germination cell wall hydrolase CwlJ-like protein